MGVSHTSRLGRVRQGLSYLRERTNFAPEGTCSCAMECGPPIVSLLLATNVSANFVVHNIRVYALKGKIYFPYLP
jgi:hypothetical protein